MASRIDSIQRIFAHVNPRPELQSAIGTILENTYARLKVNGISRTQLIKPIQAVEKKNPINERAGSNQEKIIYGKIKSINLSARTKLKGEMIDVYL